jgi:hypothetical protein
VAKHLRRRRRGSSEQPTVSFKDLSERGDALPSVEEFFEQGASDFEPAEPGSHLAEGTDGSPDGSERGPDEDWFEPSPGDAAGAAARMDVSLASMLMLGASSYQRIDGMGLARKALETPPTGDPRQDLSEEERSILANARAWCLLVHGDLGHLSRLDDPFVLADAERFVDVAHDISPESPTVETTVALLRHRQGRGPEASESIQRAMEGFAAIPEHRRSGSTQGAAVLAVITQALLAASSGDIERARVLSTAARAVVTPLDLDEAAFAALLAEVDALIVPCA